MSGWIGVDFDGTLAEYHGWNGGKLGEPIPAMLDRVKRWISEGREVRIVTARVGATGFTSGFGHIDSHQFADDQRLKIAEWCRKHIGQALPITASKDFKMLELWDDRAVRVHQNSGIPCTCFTQ